jgi:hypothetical protein
MAKFRSQRKSERFGIRMLLLMGLLLLTYGCGEPNASSTLPAPPTATEATEATEATDEVMPVAEPPPVAEREAATESIEQRLAIAGIDNPQAAQAFITQMNTAARDNDVNAIANLIHYPFTTYDTGNPLKTYAPPAELLADFDQVVTPAVIAAMSQADYDNLFANDQGAMIGNGEVWFGQFDEGLKIQAINSQ